MTKSEWNELEIGQELTLVKNPDVKLKITEIATDDRSIQNWVNRGYSDISRIIKLEGEAGYHTWAGSWLDWSRCD